MAGSACLPAITDPSAPSISPLLFSTRSSLLAALMASPCPPYWQLFLPAFLNYFSHLDGYSLSPSLSRCDSGCVCCLCQLSGWDPAPWAGLCSVSHCCSPGLLVKPWCGPAIKPWLLAKTRKAPWGSCPPLMPGSPRAAFSSLISFVSQDLMHYSALRTLRGVGKIMVLQRARAHPGDAGFSCHGLFSPSSIKSGIVLTVQEVPPRR